VKEEYSGCLKENNKFEIFDLPKGKKRKMMAGQKNEGREGKQSEWSQLENS